MSELIINPNNKLTILEEFAQKYIAGASGKQLIEEYDNVLSTVEPNDAMHIFHFLLEEGYSVEKVKSFAGKIIHIIYRPLEKFKWEKPAENHFLSYLMAENKEIETIMQKLQSISKEIAKTSTPELELSLKELLKKISAYESHYVKIENILFPYIEKAFKNHGCLKIMWSFHDDFRDSLKALTHLVQSKNYDTKQRNVLLGKLFFALLPIVFREEHIVFPVAYRALPEGTWTEMLSQSAEIGWCYIKEPKIEIEASSQKRTTEGQIDLNSGALFVEQIISMLNNLPVDITFIDENDEVRYFSEGPARVFPRSKAIIGRKVQNCHPPESVHMVNEIIEAFRSQTKSEANFWLQMHGKFLYIRYFAMISNGEYKGTIEVSQEVSDIRALEGERKLLQWE